MVEDRRGLDRLQQVVGALPAAGVALGLVDAAARLRRIACLCRGAGRPDGTASRFLVGGALAGAGVRLSVVLPAILARGPSTARSIALARFEYGSCRRSIDQSRSNQHGAFARGTAAAAGSSSGGVHAERGSRSARRSEAAARQVAGAAAHGTAIAAGAF